MKIPLTKPAPPRLSQAVSQLQEIEASGIYSNFGPVNRAFEAGLIEKMFNGKGHCTTTCNATLALMLAIRAVIKTPKSGQQNFALMPSFTFAAAAHAAIWCGLTPLFCDIDPQNWAADPRAEERLLAKYGHQISVIVPYATFGYDIDLAHYEALSRRHGIPVVIDAAASLGTLSRNGEGFGAGSNIPIIFSMHATKSFAAGEGGLVYSGDPSFIQTIKTMSNFGFGAPRCATMPGLNAKLSEVAALSGQLRLNDFEQIIAKRQTLVDVYRQSLPELSFQTSATHRQAHQFAAALLPASLAPFRADIQNDLAQQEIGLGAYFSPHLAQQNYFLETDNAAPLPVTDDIAARIISLPLYDTMTKAHIQRVTGALRASLARHDISEPSAVQDNRIFPDHIPPGLISPPPFFAKEVRAHRAKEIGKTRSAKPGF